MNETEFDCNFRERFSRATDRAVFALAIYQIVESCDCLVFNMNGRVPDEGGTFESAVAFAAGKPVVLYKRDHRTMLHGNDNAMITGLSSGFSTVNNLRDLPVEIERALTKSSRCGGASYHGEKIPPFVRLAVDLGRKVSELIAHEKSRGEETDLEVFLEKVAAVVEASSTSLAPGRS